MTFYGESLEIDFANNLVGDGAGNFGDEIRHHYDALSSTIEPGDRFVAGTFMSAGGVSGLTATDDIACAWVLELGPDTDGAITLAAGLDTTFTYSDPALATTPLGTHALSGASTLVLPVTLQTAAEVLAHDEAQILLVDGVSGAVDLQQVKLRVWPAAGPAGAWTSAPGYDVTLTAARYGQQAAAVGSVVHAGDFASPQLALDDAQLRARSALLDEQGPPLSYSANLLASGDMTFTADPFGEPTPTFWRGDGQFIERNLYLLAEPTAYPAPPGAAASGVDPREVATERYGSAVRAPGGGDPGPASFAGWTGSFTAQATSPDTADPGSVTTHELPSPPAMTQTSGSTWDIAWASHAASGGTPIPIGSTVIVDLAGGQYLVLTPQPAGRIGTPAAPTSGATVSAQVAITSLTPTYLASHAAYEWFDPSLPWSDDEQPEPRFFVKDLDDTWAPVGYGKPASETRTFHVPTPMGLYRDLTTAEYAALTDPAVGPSGSYPLRVKLEDGSWDTVAFLVPDA